VREALAGFVSVLVWQLEAAGSGILHGVVQMMAASGGHLICLVGSARNSAADSGSRQQCLATLIRCFWKRMTAFSSAVSVSSSSAAKAHRHQSTDINCRQVYYAPHTTH
jgi:hypothetical protein